MTLPLAKRVTQLAPSATLAMTQKAAELRAQGVDVIAFGVGEPDFNTPATAREAAKRAIDEGAGHYTKVGGIPPLIEAIRKESLRRRGVEHRAEEIKVSVGAKHTLYNLAMVLYEPGDEVVVPAPYWVSYPSQVQLAGASPRIVPTLESEGFKLSPDALEAALTSKTKAVILCSPSNPTGSAYTRAELRALADVLAQHHCWVIVDEIYGELVYDGFDQSSLAEVAPELRERLIIVDGMSKTYAMTGWRIGWALMPAAVAKAVEKIQGQSTTNPAAASQHAAIGALLGDKSEIAEMKRAFTERRTAMIGGLNQIPGVQCRMPEGAFYAFANVQGWLGKQAGERTLADDLAVAAWLLDEAHCAVVPGSAFGTPGYMRMSYATSLDLIEEGLARIAKAAARL